MGDIYNNPPQSRNEAILRATIDGTEYEAPPQSRIEDLLIELKEAIEQGACTGNYNDLSNKPQINGVALQGDKSISDLFDGKVDIGVDSVEESGYAELKDENGDRIFRASSANGGASVESGALIGQPGALVLYNGEGGLGSVHPKSGVSLVDVDLPAENGTLALDSQIASSQTPAKAAVVTVNDAAPINAEDITVDITPQQDLHGYDRPWAGGAGKNKFDQNILLTWGNYYEINNGKVTIKDTDSTPEGSETHFFSMPAGTFTLSVTNNCRIQIAWDGEKKVDNYNTNTITFTLPSAKSDLHVKFLASSYPFEIGTIQIEEGSTATSYAPYSNICPIEGWTGAELDRVGKNWWSLLSSYTSTSTGDWVVADTDLFLPAGEYTVSLSDLTTSQNTQFFFKNSLGTVIASTVVTSNGTRNSKIVTFSENVATVAVCMYGSGRTISAIQLELGSAATAYEPYQGQQYTASFGETVYGGKWHVTAGGTDKTYGFAEFDGSEDEGWQMEGASTAASGSKRFILLNVINYPILPSSYYPLNVITNGLSLASGDATWVGSTDNVLSISPFGTDINIRVAGIDTVEGLKTWLSNNPVQLVYELATPTTISTPKQNVPMLQGINTVSADCGDTQLKYQPDNVVGELKGEIQALDARVTALEEAE